MLRWGVVPACTAGAANSAAPSALENTARIRVVGLWAVQTNGLVSSCAYTIGPGWQSGKEEWGGVGTDSRDIPSLTLLGDSGVK